MLTMRFFKKNIYYIAWAQALVATLGSLYFSEVKHFAPCVLCWYQRIFIYPLVFIIAVGIVKKDKNLPYYVLPLTITGWFISLFHNLLYYGVIPENAAPCLAGVSCTTKFFAWFGFITIPLLSLLAFSLINICMLLARRYSQKHDKRS
jgi:disulfide bond formation protein DsbB